MKGKRWIGPAAVVLFVALTVAATSVFRSGRGETEATPPGGGPSDAVCVLTELPGTAVDKDVWASVARAHGGVVAAGARYTRSKGGPLVAIGSGKTWQTGRLNGFEHNVNLEDASEDRAGGAWVVGVMVSAPAVARWNGGSWSVDPVSDPGRDLDALSGVVGVTPRLAFAVGRHGVGSDYRTLIERWDGAAWHVVASPNVGSASNVLKDVAATGPGDVWAVGWHVAGQRYRALAEHWDGQRWSAVPTPDAGPGDAILTGVVALAPDDVWAVGWITKADVQRPLIERWNGSTWRIVPLPSDLGPAGLFAVTPTSDGIAVVGRRFVDQDPQPLALLHDGDGWHDVAVDSTPATQVWLTGVAIDHAGTMWAVGTRLGSTGLFGSLVVTGCGPV